MPSSTIAALRAALDAGVDAFELDVHCTSDGVLVVCHDTTLDRTCNIAGAISTLTWNEVSEADNSYWFVNGIGPSTDEGMEYPYRGRAPEDSSFGVARLQDVLEMFPDVVLNLDIKQSEPDVEPYEHVLASMLNKFGRVDDVIVASFLDVASERFRATGSKVATSVGTLATIGFWQHVNMGAEIPPVVADCVALQVPVKIDQLLVVTPAFVERAHEVGLAVHVWTIDDPAEIAMLQDLGVEGIMTDRPSILTGVWWG